MKTGFDFAIIGGGIIGVATAYQLQKSYPEKTVAIFEKEGSLGRHQTGNNSGVIHSGLYYKPGSKKAELCVKGRRALVEFAEKNNIPFEICGKLIVATAANEIPMLEQIFENGKANGCEGIELIDQETIKSKEPFVQGLKAIWVPTTGIIDYKIVTEAMANQITSINPDSRFFLGTKVKKVTQEELSQIYTSKGVFKAECVVFCGGLHADRFAHGDGIDLDLKIVPFRGDYYDLTPSGLHKVKNLIYPVPDPSFPFLGVHFTRMIHGGVECGPNAVFSFKREGYSRFAFNMKDAWDALTYVGLWRLFHRHWRQGLMELRRAYSKKRFLKSLQRMIPSLQMEEIKPARSGVRAQALDFYGNLVYDFKVEKNKQHYHVLNAPSPAATACLSIGEYIKNTIVTE